MHRQSNVPRWSFTGGETTVIEGLSADAEISDWYDRVVAFILTLDESSDFEVVENRYRRFPSILVTNGITALYRGHRFELWSDVPGELILDHPSMGSRIATELIRSLELLWTADRGQRTTDD